MVGGGGGRMVSLFSDIDSGAEIILSGPLGGR